MLVATVYREMAELFRLVTRTFRRLDEGADHAEIEMLTRSCMESVQRLARAINQAQDVHVGKLQRHLGALAFFHAREQPERYQADIEDITQRDLPGVIDLVEQWERDLLSPGLVQAVS